MSRPGRPTAATALVLGAGLLFLSGCSDSMTEGCREGADPELLLGKGLEAYQQADEGGYELELVHGPQGGFHVDLAIEVRFLDSSDRAEGHITGFLDGELRAESTPYIELRCNPSEDALQAWGLRLIWDAQPEELDGQFVNIQFELTDAAGTEIENSLDDILIEDPLL